MKRYRVIWPGMDNDGTIVQAKTKDKAIEKYKALATNKGEDEDMVACWPQIQRDLTVEDTNDPTYIPS